MARTPFPQSVDLETATSIVQIIKAGAPAEQRPLLSNCVWNVVGYGLRIGVGNPDDRGPHATMGAAALVQSSLDCPPEVLNEAAGCCESLINDQPEVARGFMESITAMIDTTLLLQQCADTLRFLAGQKSNQPPTGRQEPPVAGQPPVTHASQQDQPTPGDRA